MIVKMHKITLLLSIKAREAALRKLRHLGVLHIKNIQSPQSQNIEALQNEAAGLESAIKLLGEGRETPSKLEKSRIPQVVEKIHQLSESRERLKDELAELRNTCQWFEKWGSISYASIRALAEAGIFIKFYLTDKIGLKRIPEEKQFIIAREDKAMVYVAYLGETEDDQLDLKEERMPEVEMTLLIKTLDEAGRDLGNIDSELKALAAFSNSLLDFKDELQKNIEFNQVMHGMSDEGQFAYLQGYCPKEKTTHIKNVADQEGWAYVIQEPDDPVEVPTLIRNPKWLRIIDPLFKFMGTLPGYDEYDISFWFLLFFSLFFGMLIGDAGYGLVFLGLTFFASRKAGKNVPREPFRLVTVLGAATLIWGLITGNWFGFEKIARIPFLDFFVIDKIDSFASDNSMFMMYLCFIIGIIHLSIAHGIRAFKIINSPRALGELGWVCILWTLFFVAGSLVIGQPMPSFWMYLFGTGIVLALVFSNFQKNVFKGIGQTLGNLPLSIISSFSDVVSYLRLFAVSSASVTVALSFNNMAIGEGIHSIGGGLVAAFILFFGHSLNIMLGMMSVIVHGVRLNMLEFSGHLDMQWAGKKYQPFKE